MARLSCYTRYSRWRKNLSVALVKVTDFVWTIAWQLAHNKAMSSILVVDAPA